MIVDAPLDEEPPQKVIDELRRLVAAYLSEDQGFTARRALLSEKDDGPYDQLARFGEWDVSDNVRPERVG
jgi:hypothetical protein